MKTHRETIEAILKNCKFEAAGKLREKTPGSFSASEIAEIETEVLNEAPRGTRLDKLLSTVHQMVAELDPESGLATTKRAIYEYPKYTNILENGFSRQAPVYDAAKRWLAARAATNGAKRAGGVSEVSLVAQIVVSSILDFQVLNPDTILPLLESLLDNRIVKMHHWMIGIPVALRIGRQEHASERLVVVNGGAADAVRALGKHPGGSSHLTKLIQLGRRKSKKMLSEIEKEFRPAGTSAAVFTIQTLIEAACQIAIMHMPTSVLGQRTGLNGSHALNLETLERIVEKKICKFPLKSGKSAQDEMDREEEAPTATEDGKDEGQDEDPLWKRQLRRAVKRNKIDVPLLQSLAKGPDRHGSIMGGFTLHMIGNSRFTPSTIHRYVFEVANRLIPHLGNIDPRRLDQDAWEDLVERLLDNDAFYHRRRYSGGEGRDAAGYSRPLIRALGNFVAFVNHGKTAQDRVRSALPPTGILRVEAAIMTVDEYEKALAWFRGPHADHNKPYRNLACRVALILGFRLGLRRAEAAYLRVSDFDIPLPDEDLVEANLHLHVRPWLLRLLKTSNALRDLPLAVLIPKDELEELMDFVNKARKRGGWRALLFGSERTPLKAMNFEGLIDCLKTAIRGDRGLGCKAIIPGWHYHILRHSFANICLLRLWPRLGKVAGYALQHHPATLKLIGDGGAFRAALFRNPKTIGSDLQAIALLMGHGSAATGIEHYIHLLDWFGEAAGDPEVRQLNVSGPQTVGAASINAADF